MTGFVAEHNRLAADLGYERIPTMDHAGRVP